MLPPPATLPAYVPSRLGDILRGMTRKICNWTYRNVTDFLAENGFSFSEALDGSGESWVKCARNGEPITFVEIPFNLAFYSKKKLQRMIRQSGIPEEKWMEWAEPPMK